MSVDRIEVRNFQALKNVSLELGRLTVIVGDSDSGKSAFYRSVNALVSNIRGSRYVTHGTKASVISVTTSSHKVTLERGDGVGSYQITNLETGADDVHTKLGGNVPDQVSQTLNIDSDLSFAKQSSPPFLVDESGAEVARVLGKLTNVDILFGAVREAGRRRLGVVSELKTREADLAKTKEKLSGFSQFPKQLEGLKEAEAGLAKAEELQRLTEELRAVVEGVETSFAALQRTKDLVVEIPDISLVYKVWEELSKVQGVVRAVESSIEILRAAEIVLERRKAEFEEASRALHELKDKIGICSECGSVREKA